MVQVWQGLPLLTPCYQVSEEGSSDDEGAPLSLTSDKSTECYRNWWGGPDNAMLSLMNRSINLWKSMQLKAIIVFK